MAWEIPIVTIKSEVEKWSFEDGKAFLAFLKAERTDKFLTSVRQSKKSRVSFWKNPRLYKACWKPGGSWAFTLCGMKIADQFVQEVLCGHPPQ